MLAAAIAANGKHTEPTDQLQELAGDGALGEAICWGLAIRLARRLGARSQRSLQSSRLLIENDKLILRLAQSHRDLFGVSTEKDMKLLSGRLGIDWAVEVVSDKELYRSADDQQQVSATP